VLGTPNQISINLYTLGVILISRFDTKPISAKLDCRVLQQRSILERGAIKRGAHTTSVTMAAAVRW